MKRTWDEDMKFTYRILIEIIIITMIEHIFFLLKNVIVDILLASSNGIG
ncbi:MAG: hypothetical protein WA421_02435 [Nitrososphaeraceae archaeon]|jgi:hypothetical protein